MRPVKVDLSLGYRNQSQHFPAKLWIRENHLSVPHWISFVYLVEGNLENYLETVFMPSFIVISFYRCTQTETFNQEWFRPSVICLTKCTFFRSGTSGKLMYVLYMKCLTCTWNWGLPCIWNHIGTLADNSGFPGVNHPWFNFMFFTSAQKKPLMHT